MYIVAIAWLFVALMLAVAQPTLVRALLYLLFWGALPLALLLWIVGTPNRLRRRGADEEVRTDVKTGADDEREAS